MNIQAEIAELRDHIRTGEPPGEHHARTWYTAPILDAVRADIGPDERARVAAWTETRTPFVRVLAWNLIRNELTDQELETLHEQYESETDTQAKISLVFQITQRENSEEEMADYLQYLDSVPDKEFTAIWQRYFGNENMVVWGDDPETVMRSHELVMQRLNNATYAHKRVLYVYGLGRLARRQFKGLLADYLHDPNPLVRSIASRFLPQP
jgi:hypothetical protein